jgi:hypothetical protein
LSTVAVAATVWSSSVPDRMDPEPDGAAAGAAAASGALDFFGPQATSAAAAKTNPVIASLFMEIPPG